jgi:WD40 repeat protein/tRNA A-37 threonylcarbamoyl transferase component Bud32
MSHPNSTTESGSDLHEEALSQKIGRYKVLEKIGEGGFGVVYVAEQKEPVKRRVALKIIKLGMDTRQVVARFEAERQALALMDHPNIAKVLDAGATDLGRPYFVMELVRGVKLTEYCDQNKLSTKQRLELFIPVCQAIQHAHQKGIIHRDIKPSNILVTLHDGVPVPKVIDFGIAKATQQDLTDKTVYTQLQQFIGTPAYMSPEQAEMSGLDIDTRSDIYSLGVLLYELLTGRTPFDAKELMSLGIDVMRKTIREKEPLRPSTKVATLQAEDLSTTAQRRAAEAPKLISLLRGDLDWIVMKCLEKDRTRRYETANGLAVDLKRHLNNEPVFARPPSKLYEFQKTVRRHKVGFAATAAVMFVLAVGVALTTWQAVRATRAKRDAQSAQAQALQAQSNEARLRQQAQIQELAARQRAYASDMNVAAQALAQNNLGRTLELLNRQRPGPGQEDLRGWEWRYLWQQTRSDASFTLCRKSNEIESLAASPDGQWLAIGLDHKDGLFVWDLQSRQEVAHLAHGENKVRAVFSPTEPLLAYTTVTFAPSGKQSATLRLWNAATRQNVFEIPLDATCEGLAFSKDGDSLVTSTARGHLTIWRVRDGSRAAAFPCDQVNAPDGASSFAATLDLHLAAYAIRGGKLRVLDLRDGKELWTATASKEFVTALAFSPDQKTLASAAGFAESDIRLWDVASGREITRLEDHKAWVGALVFWPDGTKLASCSADQTIRIWDIAAQKCLDTLWGHHLEVWRVALLPDNRSLVSGSKDGEVCVWDTSRVHPRRARIAVATNVAAWHFTPDSHSTVTLDQAGQVARWSGNDFQHKQPLLEVGEGFENAIFSADCLFLAVGSIEGNISVWDLSRCSLRQKILLDGARAEPQAFLDHGNRLIVRSVTSNRFSEWDLQNNRELQSWTGPVGFERLGVSPDERLAIGVGWEGDVVCRNLQMHSSTLLPIDAVEGWTVAFPADGSCLAISSALGYARVWNTKAWQELATLRGFSKAVDSAVFSPDGQRLATGGGSHEDGVRLWSGDTRQELLTLNAPGSSFELTSFSPDSTSIGTLTSEHVLQVWRAPSWVEINATEARDKTDLQQP